MFLHDKETDSLVKVLDVEALINPSETAVPIRQQDGQEQQDPEHLEKAQLVFPSGESLPKCWVDADYRQK